MRNRSLLQPRASGRVPSLRTEARRSDARFVILAARFHPAIAELLVDGAVRTLKRCGVLSSDIQLLWVPGAFELPVIAARVSVRRPVPSAIIALGALIRGHTSQYEVIAHAVASGLSHVAVTATIPVTFGVIVAETLAQANARSGGREGNRGEEAALAAIEMYRLMEELK